MCLAQGTWLLSSPWLHLICTIRTIGRYGGTLAARLAATGCIQVNRAQQMARRYCRYLNTTWRLHCTSDTACPVAPRGRRDTALNGSAAALHADGQLLAASVMFAAFAADGGAIAFVDDSAVHLQGVCGSWSVP